MWDCNLLSNNSKSQVDVSFKIENTLVYCKKENFINSSKYLRNLLENRLHSIMDCSHETKKNLPLINIDGGHLVFDAYHKYLHEDQLVIDDTLLPQACLLANNLQDDKFWNDCAMQLSSKITLSNIGEICPLVCLKTQENQLLTKIDNQAKNILTQQLYDFLIKNADEIACLQSGQLSVRLYVDVIKSIETDNDDVFLISPGNFDTDKLITLAHLSDWQIAFRILEFLSQSEDRKEYERRHSSLKKMPIAAKNTVTDEIRLSIDESQLLSHKFCQEISKHEDPFNFSSGVDAFQCECKSTITTESPETETCLITSTNLNVGAISIFLCKLRGKLVSLSVKRPTETNTDVSSEISPSNLSRIERPILPLLIDNQLRRNKTFPVSKISNSNLFDEYTGNNGQRCHFESLHFNLGIPRSSFGACTFVNTNNPHQTNVLIAGGTTHSGCLSSAEILTFSSNLNRLLTSSTDEILTPESSYSDNVFGSFHYDASFYSKLGPRLSCARGRLALTITDSEDALVYACGGSDGTKDLTSVECIPARCLVEWKGAIDSLTAVPTGQYSLKTPDYLHADSTPSLHNNWQFVSNLIEPRSCAAAGIVDFSNSVVLGGQSFGKPLASVEMFVADRNEWIHLPSMHCARTKLCSSCIPNNSTNLLLAVGGICDFAYKYDISSSAHLLLESDFQCLPASAEAYDFRCSEWMHLPDLPNKGPLFGSSLLPLPSSPGRMLLVGGTNGTSSLIQTHIFDLRSWTWLCGPNLTVGRSSPSSVAVGSNILVMGGYNVHAGGFMRSLEFIRDGLHHLPTDSPISSISCDFSPFFY